MTMTIKGGVAAVNITPSVGFDNMGDYLRPTPPKSIPAEVQLVRIGDKIALFAVPGELFVEVGIKLKRAMDLPGAFVVAYANGGVGYLPSKRAEGWGWCAHDDSYRLTPHPANFSGTIEQALSEALATMMSAT